MATTEITSATTDTRTELQRLIDQFFRAVSFQSGGAPDYGSIRELFVEGARLVKDSSNDPEISTIEQFIASRQQMVDSGALTSLQEIETAEITEAFGNIAHRFSTYLKRATARGAGIEGMGVISTQFIRTPGGWRMSSMACDDGRPGLAIPAGYG